ncbi:ead/Ea22-like family protein [Enterobacter hormaechei]|uniref:ead/Ea22-like family protein n=1 Tax=Enterobacter hormaechei TaxID=158836 RepID=UPI0018C33538|nr:ead/Ea22-like family protein [Enterobacter hormaechei]MBF9845972.1 ead/Ea22-like family protein [Enterobacter hormaechei]
MSNIDKRALREAAEKASTDNHTQDEWFHYLRCSTPETVLALLDELEAAEERYEDILRQARSFREAHDSASEIIRKHERNKATVTLPTTRLWAGKIACYEESEVVAMLERAGINIAAAGKGE